MRDFTRVWHYDEVVKSILVLGWPHNGGGELLFLVLPTIAHGRRVFCYLTRGLVLTFWVDRSMLLFLFGFWVYFLRERENYTGTEDQLSKTSVLSAVKKTLAGIEPAILWCHAVCFTV